MDVLSFTNILILDVGTVIGSKGRSADGRAASDRAVSTVDGWKGIDTSPAEGGADSDLRFEG